jgi:hypothetical protein
MTFRRLCCSEESCGIAFFSPQLISRCEKHPLPGSKVILPLQATVQDFKISRKRSKAGIKVGKTRIGIRGDKLSGIDIESDIPAHTP